MRVVKNIVFIVLAGLGSLLRAQAEDKSFRLVAQQGDQWTIEYVPRQFAANTIDIDGRPYVQFMEGASEGGKMGSPQLPAEAINIGLPPHATLDARIIDSQFDDIPDQLVSPSPTIQYTESGERNVTYRTDPAYYGQNRFYPAAQLEVVPPAVLRDQRFGTIRLFPQQYNPVSRTIRRLRRATLLVRLISSDGKVPDVSPSRVVTNDPHFEQTYKSFLWNYDQAKNWRVQSLARNASPLLDPTRDWFETGRTYYTFKIPVDGWRRIRMTDLASAGADTSQIDFPSLRLYARGVEVPILLGPDNVIEFYGVQNYGDSTYVDTFTDTSAYFLTWGGAAGLRYIPSAQPIGSVDESVVSAKITRHFEQNSGYYFGAGDAEVSNNETVPGEGWAWGASNDWFYPTTQKDFVCTLDNPDAAAMPQSRLRVRLFGTTAVNNPGYDHNARFWLNDSLIRDIFFEARTEGKLDTAISSNWLRASSRLRVRSIPTATSPNLFYLDWFEVDYRRMLVAQANQLHFVSDSPAGSSLKEFTASGFTNSSLNVFDMTGRRMITGTTITGGDSAGYTVRFRDTLTSAKEYLIVAEGGSLPVLTPARKQFIDIRANSAGADYVIITHKTFASAAQRLAQHRATVNGVRTAVIDVDDIYDEFNYGIMNGTKLKTFLRYAYLQWPAPAPTYLTLLGDASWDFHKYMPSSSQTNFVPGYGIPTGDNWFVCFDPDTTLLPFMLVGRIPARDSIQAERTVDKIASYDNYTLSDWNKKYMFIAGLNFNSDFTINSQITPAPLGGIPYRVYKTTPAVIDGEHRQEMRDIVRDGVVFLNFLGHSGGRYWEVDIGDPTTLENTNGMLPFVASVSCNVGAYADPANPLLAEDFALADHRGAIASWASSTEGWSNAGTGLVTYFLDGVRTDSVRELGALTNTARIRLWRTFGDYYIYVTSVKCNPLLGDPLTRLAIPLRPDLGLTSPDISLSNPTPTPNDSSVAINLRLHNYGLVPRDSVGVTITDQFNGVTTDIVTNKRVRRTFNIDSLRVQWDPSSSIGRHILTATLDPLNQIPEVNESNNAAGAEGYVYANLISVVAPLKNMVVLPGPQALIVTSPLGLDSVGFQYFFELDTVATFDSPFRVQSGPVLPGLVKGEWMTPSLSAHQVYFWRARTMDGGIMGNWVSSSFSTSTNLPAAPLVRIREATKKQMERDNLSGIAATDSGATIAPNPTLRMKAISMGYRGGLSNHKYSQLFLNDQVMWGYEWVVGWGFMAVRVNEFDGSYVFRYFDQRTTPAQADSMREFLRSTPAGNYMGIVVVQDGRTNMTESLYVAIEEYGSALIRNVTAGQSWAFIGRKGYPGEALEILTNDSAIVNLQVPNYFSLGKGSITASGIPLPGRWDSFRWQWGGSSSETGMSMALLGLREGGGADTLGMIPRDSLSMSLLFLNRLTAGPTYTAVAPAAQLSTTNALITPVLREWSVDMVPPADLAVSSRTIGLQDVMIEKGVQLNLPVTVYNLGFGGVDSARVIVAVFDRYNRARPIASAMLDSIPAGGNRTVTIPIATSNMSRRTTLQVSVAPSKKYKDLVALNNVAYYSFTVTGSTQSGVQFFADGVQLMDGDFVAAKPRLIIRLPRIQEEGETREVEFQIDRKAQSLQSGGGTGLKAVVQSGEDLQFAPQLTSGRHELLLRAISVSTPGIPDTIEQSMVVDVNTTVGIQKIFNYPNPFRSETHFTFLLTGANTPEHLRIRIFTVAGRVIRDIEVPPGQFQIGFNKILWDGRDNDGDEVANGYYFYSIIVTGDGKTESAIQKLARLR
jgi:hypothetical protein